MTTETASLAVDTDVYKQLEEYRWDHDQEFQGGLAAILGPNPVPFEIHDLTLRAQCFYLSRKISVPISFEGYKSYLLSKQNSNIISHESPNQAPTTPSTAATDETIPTSQPQHAALASLETAPEKKAPYPPTFAEIMALITSGAPVPGVCEIPPTILTDQASISTAPRRKKPWEVDLPGEVAMGGTFGDRRDNIIVQEYPDEVEKEGPLS